MKTEVLPIDPLTPAAEFIRRAAEVLRRGGTVAFPTETVYGLGANAWDAAAVRRIFIAKGRPSDNPLIVHVAHRRGVEEVVRAVPPEAEELMRSFWPGPLTLVLPRHPAVPDAVTGGLETVGVRMPAHPVALAFIEAAGVPVAAPSANRSGRPSPTEAGHVLEDLDGRIDLVLDAGPTGVGVESTVLDLTCRPPVLLRPGGVTLEELRSVLGEVAVGGPAGAAEQPRSPGMKYAHYAPRAPMVVVEGPVSPSALAQAVWVLATEEAKAGRRVGILATAETAPFYQQMASTRLPAGTFSPLVLVVGERSRLATVAAGLFATLRRFDASGVDAIVAEGVPEEGIGLAIMNRLRKAAGYRIRRVSPPGGPG